jgi:hypothetical protein
MFNWLRRLFLEKPVRHRPERFRSSRPVKTAFNNPVSSKVDLNRPAASQEEIKTVPIGSLSDARAYLDKVNHKINSLAMRFAKGDVNRVQFQQLYAHYQDEKQTIEGILIEAPGSQAWKDAVTEGTSILIRHRHLAHVQGFSIYDNESGMPLKTIGKFRVDPALFVPMLSAYHSATKEIFGAGVRSTQIEGGTWLSFVRGNLSTTLALFTTEPSGKQLRNLEALHQTFEQANKNQLGSPMINADDLVCPHEFFIRHPL